MRAVLATVLAVVVLFLGVIGLGYQAQSVQDTAVANGTNQSAEAFNMTTSVFEGLGNVFAPGLVWFGVGVIVLLSLGLLYVHAVPGR